MFTIIVIIFVYFLTTSFTNALPIASKPKSTLDEHVVLQSSDAESLQTNPDFPIGDYCILAGRNPKSPCPSKFIADYIELSVPIDIDPAYNEPDRLIRMRQLGGLSLTSNAYGNYYSLKITVCCSQTNIKS